MQMGKYMPINSIGFLLFHEVEELDFVGPWEMIGIWGRMFDGPKKIITVSQHGGEIKCSKGLVIKVDNSFSNCPKLDCLVVPGGWGTRAEVNNSVLINFIRTTTVNCSHVLSICTGAFLLQSAGLLDNKRATTHWKSLARLRAFKLTTVVEERIVKDGNILTSAGISAGIDMTLKFISEVAGEETASKVQLQAEYYPSGKVYGNVFQQPEVPSYLKEAAIPKSPQGSISQQYQSSKAPSSFMFIKEKGADKKDQLQDDSSPKNNITRSKL